jgi:hypothetical protein
MRVGASEELFLLEQSHTAHEVRKMKCACVEHLRSQQDYRRNAKGQKATGTTIGTTVPDLLKHALNTVLRFTPPATDG